MPFQQGQSGNPQGRPKGAKGKITSTVKESIEQALTNREEDLGMMLDRIKDPYQWIAAYTKLAAFVVPKPSISVSLENDLSGCSDEELNQMVKDSFDTMSKDDLQEYGLSRLEEV